MVAEGFTYDDMLLRPVPNDIKDKLGTLLLTKKMNAPAFFSLSYTIGVYIPILAPLLTPLVLTFVDFLKAKYKRNRVNQ